MQQAMQDTIVRLQGEGRKPIDVGRDGSCFYHAIAHQINTRFPHLQEKSAYEDISIPCTQGTVREKTALWLMGEESNEQKKLLKQRIEAGAAGGAEKWTTWGEFIEDVYGLKGNTWASAFSIVAVSAAYNMPIFIWNTMGKDFDRLKQAMGVQDNGARFEVLHELYGIDEKHYQSVHFIDEGQDPALAPIEIDE